MEEGVGFESRVELGKGQWTGKILMGVRFIGHLTKLEEDIKLLNQIRMAGKSRNTNIMGEFNY